MSDKPPPVGTQTATQLAREVCKQLNDWRHESMGVYAPVGPVPRGIVEAALTQYAQEHKATADKYFREGNAVAIRLVKAEDELAAVEADNTLAATNILKQVQRAKAAEATAQEHSDRADTAERGLKRIMAVSVSQSRWETELKALRRAVQNCIRDACGSPTVDSLEDFMKEHHPNEPGGYEPLREPKG